MSRRFKFRRPLVTDDFVSRPELRSNRPDPSALPSRALLEKVEQELARKSTAAAAVVRYTKRGVVLPWGLSVGMLVEVDGRTFRVGPGRTLAPA